MSYDSELDSYFITDVDVDVAVVEDVQEYPEPTVPWAGYNKIFTFVGTKGNSIITKCTLCGPTTKTISATKNSASNLKRHLLRNHPENFKEITEDISIQSNLEKKRKRPSLVFESVVKKNATLDKWVSSDCVLLQEVVDKKVINFVIEETMPPYILDKPSFIDLVQLGLPNEVSIMSAKTLRERIERKSQDMREDLAMKMAHVDCLATTADCWTHDSKSFLEVTAHWIDPQTLKRVCYTLACKRVMGHLTYDVLVRELNDIYARYKIQRKVVCITTDNGSNFGKAFQVLGSDCKLVDLLIIKTDPECQEDDIEHVSRESIEYIRLNEILDVYAVLGDDAMSLPVHRRCASHTLNLVATEDVEHAVVDQVNFKQLYVSTLAKCKNLWSKQKQSQMTADYIKEVTGMYLIVPNETRWHSTYDSFNQIKAILSTGSDKINSILDYCCVARLTPPEIQLLNEYCDIMRPLAYSLDVLQSDNGMYTGYLLPTLHTLDKKLEAIEKSPIPLIHCLPLVQALRSAILTRFGPIWMDKDLVLAACLHPRFKLDWLNGTNRATAEAWLKSVLQDDDQVAEVPAIRDREVDSAEEDDFFCIPSSSKKSNDSASVELDKFLKRKNTRDVKLLLQFPRILKNFIPKNTAVPSSAGVEHLFNTGGNVMTIKRHLLSDDMFENLVLLKTNKFSTEV